MWHYASLERGYRGDVDAIIVDNDIIYKVVIVKGEVESIGNAHFAILDFLG